ncbi:putative KRAB-A domain protein, partial [Gregarina niphandrodes]
MKLQGKVHHDLVGVVLPESKQLILGVPYLLDHHAKLYMKEGWIQLDDEWFQLCKTHRPLKAFRSVMSCEIDQGMEARLESQLQNIDEGSVKQELRRILLRFSELWRDDSMGRTSVIRHAIHVISNRPIACRCRKYSEEQKKIIETEVKSMLEKGVVRPSESPYASGIVLVKKKTGEWRFCIDYSPL